MTPTSKPTICHKLDVSARGRGNWTSCLLGTVHRFHRDDGAQMLFIGAIFTMVLVILLTVTVNLGYVTHQKIQAQNAADAAAMAAGIWQVRGLSFVQSLNNVIVLSDSIAYGGIIAAVVLNATAHADPTGISIGLGNLALAFTVGCHGASQFILMPFRHAHAYMLGPMLCYVSASEMAKANYASPVLSSALGVGVALGVAAGEGNSSIGAIALSTLLSQHNVQETTQWAENMLAHIPIYAMNLELLNGEFIRFDLQYSQKSGQDPKPPLPVPLKVDGVSLLLQATYMIQPMNNIADQYFSALDRLANPETKGESSISIDMSSVDDHVPEVLRYAGELWPKAPWQHDYLISTPNFPENDSPQIVRLPPTTWVAMVRETSRKEGERYGGWTAAWSSMGGLGVKTGDGQYGELGAVAFSRTQVFTDPVTWFDFSGFRGWIEMIPAENIPYVDEIGVLH